MVKKQLTKKQKDSSVDQVTPEEKEALGKAFGKVGQAMAGVHPGEEDQRTVPPQDDPFDLADPNWDSIDGWETASAMIWQPEEGDELHGIYDGSEPFLEGTLDTEVLKHFVVQRGTEIRYSFVGGQVFDKSLAKVSLNVGDLVKFTFLGQRDCKAGRVNLFDIRYKRK